MADHETVVVLVEDDPNIADLVDLYLRQAGYRVYQAADGERGLELIEQRQPAIVILDIGLPGALDGLDLCRQIRDANRAAVLMLTARGDEVDRVLGLELGADDYLAKPFSPRELVARVKAILRRVDGPPLDAPAILRSGVIEVDVGRREVRRNGEPVALATREFELLQHLAEHRGLALCAASCSTRSGAPTGWATSARSTCTCASCARSSGTTSSSPRSGASAIASTDSALGCSQVAHTWARKCRSR